LGVVGFVWWGGRWGGGFWVFFVLPLFDRPPGDSCRLQISTRPPFGFFSEDRHAEDSRVESRFSHPRLPRELLPTSPRPVEPLLRGPRGPASSSRPSGNVLQSFEPHLGAIGLWSRPNGVRSQFSSREGPTTLAAPPPSSESHSVFVLQNFPS